MEAIDALNEQLRNLQAQIAEKNREKKRYEAQAQRIGVVYERMSDDKKLLINYRDSVKTFKDEKYAKFSGYLYSNAYLKKMNELIESYGKVIDKLDDNMDALNQERKRYENMAYKCNGVIGYLQSAVNSIEHSIQNMFN